MNLHKWIVTDYERMIAAGIFAEDDRALKLPRYAVAGIPEAWLIDLGAETVERHTEPRDGYYRFVALAMRGDTLASTVLPALTIPADLVLGPVEE
jgi:Uma2 family endonuclease